MTSCGDDLMVVTSLLGIVDDMNIFDILTEQMLKKSAQQSPYWPHPSSH